MVDGRISVGSFTEGLRALAFGSPLYSLTLGRGGPTRLEAVPPDPWPGDADRGAALCAGEYRFAGRTLVSEIPLWQPVGVGDAFLAELHGFDWLRDLRAVGGDAARRQARNLVGSWIDRHDSWHPLTWRPDVLGLRISNWLGTHDFYCASADDRFRARIFASLFRQTRHLARALPGRMEGASLLVALKGLFYGMLCLPGAESRMEPAQKLLAQALKDQVLPDGGHVQRSPSIHLDLLCHLIDLRAVMRAAKAEVPEALQHAIDRMTPTVRFFLHGDGGLALFNGTREGEAVLVDTALAQADAPGRPLKSARHCGFERVQAGRTLVLMDVGHPPPAGLDAGTHAGTLSFELSVGRERLIVNCGSMAGLDPAPNGGQTAAWALALRGTAAHSTLTVDDTNSSEAVADGGLARRPAKVSVERQEEDGAVLIDASHDGYRRPFGLTHHRRVFINATGDDIRGEDRLEGGGSRPFALRFHLHPSVQVSAVQGGNAALLRLGGGAGWRLRANGGELSIEESVYCGVESDIRRTSQVVITGRTEAGNASTLVKWGLRRERKG